MWWQWVSVVVVVVVLLPTTTIVGGQWFPGTHRVARGTTCQSIAVDGVAARVEPDLAHTIRLLWHLACNHRRPVGHLRWLHPTANTKVWWLTE